jgi:hypothetical protein
MTDENAAYIQSEMKRKIERDAPAELAAAFAENPGQPVSLNELTERVIRRNSVAFEQYSHAVMHTYLRRTVGRLLKKLTKENQSK